METLNFIVNPKSGRGSGEALWEKIKAALDAKDVPYTVHITTGKADTRDAARAVSGKGILCAIGGDGTFHDVINAADLENTPIAFLPNGRGNDFAKGTKMCKDAFAALDAVLENRRIDVDCIDVSGIKCLNVAGTGIDVDVLKRVYEQKSLTYIGSVVYNLKHFKPYKVKVTADAFTYEGECVMVGVCNGTQIGGGIKISPASVIDDGKLNVVLLEKPKRGVMHCLALTKRGKHLDKPFTRHFLTERVEIETFGADIQLDGEIYNAPLNCRLIKGGVKTFC